MSFTIYPDAETAVLLNRPVATPIWLAAGEAMREFVPLANHVGPDPALANAPTVFIRIAVFGLPPPDSPQPKFELLAHAPDRPGGSPAPALDPNTAVGLATAVPLHDDVNDTSAALAYFVPPFLDNVYVLRVIIEIPGTRLWIRITNTGTDPDVESPRSYVWVVADNDADTQQPWIQLTRNGIVPADIRFDVAVGQAPPIAVQQISFGNFGSGPFTVDGIVPALTAPYTISGLPLTVGPNPLDPVRVAVGFKVPGAPGDIAQQVFSVATSAKTDPGPFGRGHNNQFLLSAHTRHPAPAFAASPHQFDPKLGQPGLRVTLSGANFDVGNVAVRFGTVPARILSGNAQQITVTVPEMDPGSVKITVATAGGSVTSTDDFRIPPLPVIDELDPDSGRPGDVFSVLGSDLITEPGAPVSILAAFPTDPSSPEHGPFVVVGTPTATRIDVRVPQFNGEFRFQIIVSRSDGAEVMSDGDFQITLL